MPDLVTHVALAHLFRRGRSQIKRKKDNSLALLLFYWGTILPDILTRPFFILFPGTTNWLLFFHTPAAMAVLSLMLARAFPLPLRRMALGNLFGGAMLHFVLDLFQRQVLVNHFWLFPFSWESHGLGVAWPHQIMACIPIWLVMITYTERHGLVLGLSRVYKRCQLKQAR